MPTRLTAYPSSFASSPHCARRGLRAPDTSPRTTRTPRRRSGGHAQTPVLGGVLFVAVVLALIVAVLTEDYAPEPAPDCMDRDPRSCSDGGPVRSESR